MDLDWLNEWEPEELLEDFSLDTVLEEGGYRGMYSENSRRMWIGKPEDTFEGYRLEGYAQVENLVMPEDPSMPASDGYVVVRPDERIEVRLRDADVFEGEELMDAVEAYEGRTARILQILEEGLSFGPEEVGVADVPVYLIQFVYDRQVGNHLHGVSSDQVRNERDEVTEMIGISPDAVDLQHGGDFETFAEPVLIPRRKRIDKYRLRAKALRDVEKPYLASFS